LFVLTGAGCSTDSGIPDYRDENGDWKRARPVMFQALVGDLNTRRRYWARSHLGWRGIARARPNPAHHAVADLQRAGLLTGLITELNEVIDSVKVNPPYAKAASDQLRPSYRSSRGKSMSASIPIWP